MRRAVDQLAAACACAALVVLAAPSARATVLDVATHLEAVASHAAGVASGLGYRFVTDQAGDLRVDWSRVASGDPLIGLGLACFGARAAFVRRAPPR